MTPEARVERMAKVMDEVWAHYANENIREHDLTLAMARAALREMHLQPDRSFEEWVVVAQRAGLRVAELEKRVAALEEAVREAGETAANIAGCSPDNSDARLLSEDLAARLRALVG